MRNRAFTLLEILVVMCVVGVLAALLIPVCGHMRENARRSSCLSHLRQVAQAIQIYVQDNVHLPPQDAHFLRWDYYQPYTKSTGLFICPSAASNTPGPYWQRQIPSGATLAPEARTVVVYCPQHAFNENALHRGDASGGYLDGPYLAARWDASAKLILGSQTRQWVYQKGKWHLQLPVDRAPLESDDLIETRFPDEEWPLQWR